MMDSWYYKRNSEFAVPASDSFKMSEQNIQYNYTSIYTMNGNANYIYCTSPNSGEVTIAIQYLSRLMRKPAICIGENKGADQLRGTLHG